MDFYEQLPADCPPKEAIAIEKPFFRLGSIPPGESDFWSHRKRFPHKVFKVDACIAMSLSVFDDLDAVLHLKRLLPAMRSKSVFQLNLTSKDGVVSQTGNDAHHFSWWRSTEFDLSTIKILDT